MREAVAFGVTCLAAYAARTGVPLFDTQRTRQIDGRGKETGARGAEGARRGPCRGVLGEGEVFLPRRCSARSRPGLTPGGAAGLGLPPLQCGTVAVFGGLRWSSAVFGGLRQSSAVLGVPLYSSDHLWRGMSRTVRGGWVLGSGKPLLLTRLGRGLSTTWPSCSAPHGRRARARRRAPPRRGARPRQARVRGRGGGRREGKSWRGRRRAREVWAHSVF
jgi:hypothetical protein